MNKLKELRRNINLSINSLAHPIMQLDAVQVYSTEFREIEPLLSRKAFRRGEQVIRVVEKEILQRINN